MSAALLAWYDRTARALPWRTPPGSGTPPDPYRVWLSEVMLQPQERDHFLRESIAITIDRDQVRRAG